MINYIALQMAQQLVQLGEHEEARAFVAPCIVLYRRERWAALLYEALRLLLACAAHAGDVSTGFVTALELAGAGFDQPPEARIAHLRMVECLMAGKQPEAVGELQWAPLVAVAAGSALTARMGCLGNALAAKAVFASPTAVSAQSVTLFVCLRSTLPGELAVHSITPHFNQAAYANVSVHVVAVAGEDHHEVALPAMLQPTRHLVGGRGGGGWGGVERGGGGLVASDVRIALVPPRRC